MFKCAQILKGCFSAICNTSVISLDSSNLIISQDNQLSLLSTSSHHLHLTLDNSCYCPHGRPICSPPASVDALNVLQGLFYFPCGIHQRACGTSLVEGVAFCFGLLLLLFFFGCCLGFFLGVWPRQPYFHF